MKIGFYVLGKKGLFVLAAFTKEFGSESIVFVTGGLDPGIENDRHDEIADFCSTNSIFFHARDLSNDELLPNADFRFAIGWRWLIRNTSNLIVIHDSLLPKYRGFAPLVNMLIDGKNEIGVTALFASNEYDKGELIYQERKLISYPKKISTAIDEIIPLYADLVIKTAKDIFTKGQPDSFPQDESVASYSLWRDEMDYFVDWKSDAIKIKRFVDAVGTPYHGAATFLNDAVIRIFDGIQIPDVTIENRAACIGKIIFIDDLCPVIVCGSGLFKVTNLRSENGNSLIGKIQFRSRFENKK